MRAPVRRQWRTHAIDLDVLDLEPVQLRLELTLRNDDQLRAGLSAHQVDALQQTEQGRELAIRGGGPGGASWQRRRTLSARASMIARSPAGGW